jgi:hypothetical protein
MADLNLALSLLRNITVGGKLLKTFASREYNRSKKKKKKERYVGIGSLKMRLIPCIILCMDEFV